MCIIINFQSFSKSLISTLLSASVLLCLFSFPVVQAKDAQYEKDQHRTGDWARRDAFVDPETLGEKVVQQWTGGQWDHKGVTGVYRFVIVEHLHLKGAHKLYVQWLKNIVTQGQESEELAYSLSVRELSEFPRFIIQMPVCEEPQRCQKIKVSTAHVHEETRQYFTVVLEQLGRYRFLL